MLCYAEFVWVRKLEKLYYEHERFDSTTAVLLD